MSERDLNSGLCIVTSVFEPLHKAVVHLCLACSSDSFICQRDRSVKACAIARFVILITSYIAHCLSYAYIFYAHYDVGVGVTPSLR
jgi:hypothetical protein